MAQLILLNLQYAIDLENHQRFLFVEMFQINLIYPDLMHLIKMNVVVCMEMNDPIVQD